MELEQTTLFKGITSYECFRRRSCFEMREESFLAGETVMRYGDGKSEIGIVLEGSVFATRYTIDGERMFIEYIEAGDLFGESLAFAGMEDDISIVCHENAKVIFIDKKHIVKRCENACRFHTDFVQNFIEALSERTVKLSERVEILSNRSTREKLISEVWGYDFYGDDRTVDTHVKMLRGNLKQYRKFIVTLRGLGYKFEV